MSFEEFPKVSIRKGRDWQLKRGHPWLFSGAISQTPGNLNAGDIVDLLDVNGKFIARGFHNSATDIAVRVLTYEREERIDSAFLRKRIANAWQLRLKKLDLNKTNVFRLINAEGDFLPGFIVDYFDGILSVQSHTAGSDKLLEQFVAALQDQLQPKSIVVRNDAAARRREHLPMEEARIIGEECPEPVQVMENDLRFLVDILKGQKTGFFTDQRDKRYALQDCRAIKRSTP
jgi:23S rRNA (cytosine1962-C5)-methyltransferase